MPVRLDRVQVDLAEGHFASAVELLWKAVGPAQETDDLKALRLIWGYAEEVSVRGGLDEASQALRIMDAVASLHPDAAGPAARDAAQHLPITTGNELPGYRITRLIGPVFGLAVRSRDVFTQWGARIQGGTIGGELKGMTDVMEQSRVQVLARLEQRARQLGATGIIGMRFDVSQMAETWTEIAAYGTAVQAEMLGGHDVES
jgi:uncharacterized protein YbjQ (UPF0145 family)